jgi:hypothetical protein
MKCEYLKDRVCDASLTHIAPSASDRQVYCDTEDHDHCPLFLAHVLRISFKGEKIERYPSIVYAY